MTTDEAVKIVYDKFVKRDFEINTRSEKKASAEVGKYYAHIRSTPYILEIVVYERDRITREFLHNSFLCYIRDVDSFSKLGNYQPLVKYIESLYVNEKLENVD